MNLLLVKCRSDLVLRLEIIKKIIAFTVLFISMFFGLKAMCLGQALYSFIDFGLNTLYTKRILNYGFFPQLRSMAPYFLCSWTVLAEGLLLSSIINIAWVSLLASMVVCPATYWFLSKIANLYAYREAKDLFEQKILKRTN